MIVDTSAIVAIVRSEPEAADFIAAIADAEVVRISTATYVEACVVLNGVRDAMRIRFLDEFLRENRVLAEPVTEDQARIARDAYRDYGRGSEHPARLNFGDCFAYALAAVTGEPLLFKGDDFIHTDIKPAV